MNDQSSKILVDLLQKASNGIDSAVSFSQAQIPDVVHQLLVWNFVSSMLFQFFVLLAIAGYAFAAYKFVKISSSNNLGDGVLIVSAISLMFGACFTVGLSVAFFSYFDWLKIWLAPKLYLIDYAASLIK